MNIREKMIYDRTTYVCKCQVCNTECDVDKEDLHYAGHMHLYWICPVCGSDVFESIFKINRKKALHYKCANYKKED